MVHTVCQLQQCARSQPLVLGQRVGRTAAVVSTKAVSVASDQPCQQMAPRVPSNTTGRPPTGVLMKGASGAAYDAQPAACLLLKLEMNRQISSGKPVQPLSPPAFLAGQPTHVDNMRAGADATKLCI